MNYCGWIELIRELKILINFLWSRFNELAFGFVWLLAKSAICEQLLHLQLVAASSSTSEHSLPPSIESRILLMSLANWRPTELGSNWTIVSH